MSFVADSPAVDEVTPSPNHDARPAGIDAIVLHYTGMPSGPAALDWLCNPRAKVSSHYLVEEDGRVFQLVPEARRAWHAGVSYWAGRTRLNDCSVGIEIVNPGHQFGYRPFPTVQLDAVRTLVRDVAERHAISDARLLAHSDIAPDRKEDPGELFSWDGLIENVGSDDGPAIVADPKRVRPDDLLSDIGYGVRHQTTGEDLTACCIRAFQRRYRPTRVDGLVDDETYQALLRIAASRRPSGARSG